MYFCTFKETTLRRVIIYTILSLLVWPLWATHQRSGEITYEHLSGLSYRFTIVTYTYTPSPADRPEIEVYWGDGSSSVIPRQAKNNMGNDISQNIYVGDHTYAGNGVYTVSFEDPNRNAGIVNIPNSVSIPFYIESTLIINPFLGGNSSPQLLNAPIDNGCINTPYYHNPGAYDPDGDSLSFSLITCRGYEGEDIPGYTLPAASNFIQIDPVTGDLTWDSPLMVGEYNIAILIQEWRHGVLIGNVVRDMQISIIACNNHPPKITATDTCVTAGTKLILPITATDQDGGIVTLNATGSCFLIQSSPATFTDTSGIPPVSYALSWQTECQHIKATPYTIFLKATDDGPQLPLSTYKTIYISIIAPKPENLDAIPVGNSVHLDWDSYTCQNGIGFKIYRRDGSYPFEPEPCEVGMPNYAGYTLIGSTNHIADTSFMDDGSTYPLYHGHEYCYRITAYFADGAESYVSDEICVRLANDAPLITHIDVEETHPANGIIHVSWHQPTEFDSLQFPGPEYQYRIFRKNRNSSSAFIPIDTTYSLHDTSIIDMGLNTTEQDYLYKVEFWGMANDSLRFIESSDISSSLYLNIEPMDKKMKLHWNEKVAWENRQYTIYKLSEDLHSWDSIAETSEQFYIDENLENGKEYCYFIRSTGGYFVPDSLFPLYNRSQKKCGIPIDNIPPDIPEFSATTDCQSVFLTWQFNTPEAAEDVQTFYIYYKATLNENFMLIDSLDNTYCNGAHCGYTLDDLPFVTGCFAINARDNNYNYSQLSDSVCFDVDDCMDYHLPNVFTPNDDGINDLFQPYQPYSNVEKIDITIYNRWGREVFHTEEPNINWDGKDYLSKQRCSDGTYFYSCDVYLHSLTGLLVKPLHGSITLITNR